MPARPIRLALLCVAALSPTAHGQTLLAHFDTQALAPALGWEQPLGAAVVAVGDLDGDGGTDLAFGGRGVWGNSSAGCGVWSGRTLAFLGNVTPPAVADLAQFGSALAPAGDVDGDGLPDLLVGAPGGVQCSFPFGCFGSTRGAASVHSGAGLGAVLVREGTAEGDLFGTAVAGLGDVDGDGVPDVACGAPQGASAGSGGPGYVRVFSGADGALLYQLDGAQPGAGFGLSLAGPGDVDGDGVRDLLVGAPWNDGAASGSGWAGLYRGSDGLLLHDWGGLAAGDGLGQVAAAGDVDGDGLPDVLVGTPGHDGAAGADAGVARVHSGLDGSELLAWEGHLAGEGFGTSLAGFGDANADGHAELVVGSFSSGLAPARVRVFSGRSGALLQELDDQVPAVSAEPYFVHAFGRVVAPAGDVNGDGIPDFITPSPMKILAGGDVIKLFGGQHTYVFSGRPLPATSLPQPGTPGAGGVPQLAGSGSTLPDQELTLLLSAAVPGAPVLLAVGAGLGPELAAKGVWVQLGSLLVLGPADAVGQAAIAGRWPAGLGYGDVLVAQAVVLDASAEHGLATSNVLQLTGE